MKPYLIVQMGPGNRMLKALVLFIRDILQNPGDVDSPELLDDQIQEWLGEHGHRFERCRPKAIVTLVRRYEPAGLSPNHYHHPCLRIYQESTHGLQLFLFMAIGFKNDQLNESND
jgi:hypothetical protein